MLNRLIWRLPKSTNGLNASFENCIFFGAVFELQLSFQIFLLQLNGINAQGESIADNGGIKEAYRAYRKWTEEDSPELKLPGLDYTPEQMFCKSAGQPGCSKQG